MKTVSENSQIKEDLIERLNGSKFFNELSNDDRDAILEGINRGGEITISDIRMLLEQERLLSEYLKNVEAEIIDEVVDIATTTFERTEKMRKIQEAGEIQHEKDVEDAENLLN